MARRNASWSSTTSTLTTATTGTPPGSDSAGTGCGSGGGQPHGGRWAALTATVGGGGAAPGRTAATGPGPDRAPGREPGHSPRAASSSPTRTPARRARRWAGRTARQSPTTSRPTRRLVHDASRPRTTSRGCISRRCRTSCRKFLTQDYRREIPAKSAWCTEWWKHPEAVCRLSGMWRSWEALRLEPGTGTSVWWRDYADHHLAKLLDPQGPYPTHGASRVAAGVSLTS
jgi:hypothetical protein